MQISAHDFLQEGILRTISEAAQEEQCEAYAIGGYVRDTLLGKAPKDIDIVSIGAESGLRLAHRIARKLPRIRGRVVVHKNFGTAQLSVDDYVLEFTTARRESYRGDSRKPEVTAASFMEDQKRRDFTINTLAVGLNGARAGLLVDNFGGVEDLKKGLIRAVCAPEKTFSDDPLRMMRAIRFATQLGFSIAEDTRFGIERTKERISIVSQERITDELNKIILAKKPSEGFLLLFKTGLLALIFPEMHALEGVEVVDKKRHKDNFYHTLEVLDNISVHTNSLWLRWAAILHDIAKPLTRRFCQRSGWTFHGHEEKGARMTTKIFRHMRLSMDRCHYVRKLVRLHLRPIALAEEGITDSAVRRLLYEAGKDVEDLMTLCRADITSKNPKRVARYLANFEKVEEKMQAVEAKDKIRNFQPPIDGAVIMQSFGIGPQPVVGLIKGAIKNAILDGVLKNDFHEAYQFMLKLGAQHSLTARPTSHPQRKEKAAPSQSTP